MFFDNIEQYKNSEQCAITVFGMSGVGKTHLSAILRKDNWFHYSIDYRIGTRHMGEYIVDNFKREAMKVPFLRDLLTSDSIYICSNITFDNLEPLSTYLGTPGDPKKGGLPLKEYKLRQEQHRVAEIYALKDTAYFIERARNLYNYKKFINDTGGSLIEVIDLENPNDEIIKILTENTALLYIEGSDEDIRKLIERFKNAPKPMYYRPEFLQKKWQQYKELHSIKNDLDVDPKDFASWGFEALLYDRLPRYKRLAQKYGYIIGAQDVATIRDEKDFNDLMVKAIKKRNN